MSVTIHSHTVTGAGKAYKLPKFPKAHTIQVNMGGPTVATAVTLDIELSLDGIKWFSVVSHAFSAGEITAESAMFHLADMPTEYIRSNLTTLTGGTNPTITVMHVWSEV